MARTKGKPKLLPVLRLMCPYCGQTPLRKKGAWFSFGPGCVGCDYAFERELGYYAGASWMVNFPVVAVSGFLLAALLMIFAKDLSAEVIASISCVYILIFGAWFTPYSMALWMYGEHLLHPLNEDDSFSQNEIV